MLRRRSAPKRGTCSRAPVFGEDLATEVGRRYGAPVQMMQLNHGIFDEASISVIASDTVREIGRLAGRSADVRRFRPNVVVRLLRSMHQRQGFRFARGLVGLSTKFRSE